MSLRARLLSILFLLLAFARGALCAPGDRTPVPNRYLALYAGSSTDAAGSVRAAGGRVVYDHAGAGLLVAESDAPTFAGALGKAKGFTAVMQDQQVQWDVGDATSGPGGAVLERAAPSAAVLAGEANTSLVQSPFAAFFLPVQWNIFRTHTDEAWAITQGSPTIKVAVVDSGICTHQLDLIDKVDVEYSTSFVPPDQEIPDTAAPACVGCPAWEDRNGHGTLVASIISSNNVGVAGVAPQVRLRAVKTINAAGIGLFSWDLLGILYAADTGNDVINCSFGVLLNTSELARLRDPTIPFLIRGVSYAQRKGALVVAGSGNDAVDLDKAHETRFIPCESGAGLCVGGTTFTDALYSDSNHGVSAVDMVAPSGGFPVDPFTPTQFNVLVPGACSAHSVAFPQCATGDFYRFALGTSLATPMVSGAAALLAGYDPSLWRQPHRLKSALVDAADDLGAPGADNLFSKGRLNTLRALQ